MDDIYNKAIVSKETELEVTQLYKTHTFTNEPLFKDPSKIKDDPEVMSFITDVYDEAFEIFEHELEESIAQEIAELEDRYKNSFEKFINETSEHLIKTALGRQKVILHTIEFSNKLLNRLSKRLKIDLEESGLRNSDTVANRFKTLVDGLKTTNYEKVCKQFGICRIGNEFSDYIDDLLTILLDEDSVKIYIAVDAMTKILKNTDFSRIMDVETQKAFKQRVSAVEESSSLDRRVLLTTYRVVIENRHLPFFEDDSEASVKPLAALLHVIEVFNKNLKLSDEKQRWNNIEKDLKDWSSGKNRNVTKISQEFVNTIQKGIEKFDENALSDIKSKSRIFMLAKREWLDLSRFVS
ncbi:uncharacterized protein [Epargyreus clarus]|uniref:uncharacterized protein n=1 Tax=Epargyreus clarus TaxID=520877 RepID=UPI003C30CB82